MDFPVTILRPNCPAIFAAAPPAGPIAITLVGTKGTQVGNTIVTGDGTSTGTKFLAIATHDGVRAVSTAVDNKGNTYVQVGTTQANANAGVSMFLCESGTGGSGHHFTFDFGVDAAGVAYLYEITNAQATALDKVAQGNDVVSPFEVTSPTLSQPNELVVCAICGDVSGTAAWASSNMTIIGEEQNGSAFFGGCVGSLVVAATTAVTPSFTRVSGAPVCALIVATFKQ